MTTPQTEEAVVIGQAGTKGAGIRETALTAAPGTQPPELPRGTGRAPA